MNHPRIRPPHAFPALPAGALRAANTRASASSAAIDPDTRAPGDPVLGADGVGGPGPVPVARCLGSGR